MHFVKKASPRLKGSFIDGHYIEAVENCHSSQLMRDLKATKTEYLQVGAVHLENETSPSTDCLWFKARRSDRLFASNQKVKEVAEDDLAGQMRCCMVRRTVEQTKGHQLFQVTILKANSSPSESTRRTDELSRSLEFVSFLLSGHQGSCFI